MTVYRVYCLDHRGKISKGEWLEADTLEAAIETVRETYRGQHCEIWDGPTQVAVVPPATQSQAFERYGLVAAVSHADISMT